MIAKRKTNGADQFLIRPNSSMAWRETVVVYAWVCCVSLTIGLGFLSVGLWPVLPFAGLEVLALGAAFYVYALRTRVYELVTVTPSQVRVERGPKRVAVLIELTRAWARVMLLPPRYRWYPSRLMLCAQGQGVEVGAFLTEDERVGLARDLRASVASGR